MLQKEIYNNIFNKKANVVNESLNVDKIRTTINNTNQMYMGMIASLNNFLKTNSQWSLENDVLKYIKDFYKKDLKIANMNLDELISDCEMQAEVIKDTIKVLKSLKKEL
jgi:hypothetical protein